jgi:regulator of replication initiation timing
MGGVCFCCVYEKRDVEYGHLKSVQIRLVQENKTLSVERSHLADLMANVQRMHGDLERSGENDRRRLENQIQAMDDQACVSGCALSMS